MTNETQLREKLGSARQLLHESMSLLNNDMTTCKGCGRAHYDNFEDHQILESLMGMHTKISNILDRRARNAANGKEIPRDAGVA